MAILRLPKATRNDLAQRFQVLLDAGMGPATIEIRSGVMPNAADDVATGELLAVLTCASPCASRAVDGELVLASISEDPSASATGSATWARARDASGSTVFDCDVGGSRGGATLSLNTTAVVTGGPVRITDFVLEVAGG